MNRSAVIRLAGVASLALGVAVALGAPAQAASAAHKGHGGGTCSANSTIKFKADGKKKGIKVTAKVATGVAGEAWDWTISDNGTQVAGDESSTGSDGKLVVRATVPNLDGSDTVDFAATDTVTGETCTAEAVVG